MSRPDAMTAIEIREPGPPEVLRPTQRPVPEPGEGEVLIQVAAAGVNRPDVLQRQGHYAPPPGVTDIPGLEVAGRIVAVGSGRERLAAWATRSARLVAGGGYAEYCVAPAGQCLPLPSGLSMVQAAVLPETFFTVWSNVFDRGGLRAGETFLVHGGPSGIGTTAIQLAKACGAPGVRHRRQRREVQGLRGTRRRAGDQLSRGGFRRRRQGPHGRQGRRRRARHGGGRLHRPRHPGDGAGGPASSASPFCKAPR